ncbi:MAG: hypothetical protein ACP5E2_16350 [Terracidiphilus sp.]
MKVRAKHRKRTQFELPPLESVDAQSAGFASISALKIKPILQKPKSAHFVFQENEPLTLTATGGEQ